jgi:hypothetical protein
MVMMITLFRRIFIVVLLGCTMGYVAGCGKSVSGKYADDSGAFSVEFKSDGKATVAIAGSTIDATYTIDGKSVSVNAGGDIKTFTINDDGSLGGPGVTLKKK